MRYSDGLDAVWKDVGVDRVVAWCLVSDELVRFAAYEGAVGDAVNSCLGTEPVAFEVGPGEDVVVFELLEFDSFESSPVSSVG